MLFTFFIKISKKELVGKLKDAIKAKKASEFNNFPANYRM
jgi:hypothetical protein